MSSIAEAYDRVPYPSAAFPQTHPDRLAVIATLHGMHPPDAEHCRVLELGCGDGGNLIPMAYGLPSCTFVGVELAPKPVEAAEERIRRTRLTNIRVQQLDLMEVGGDFGEFDYIIAHGVYAWVPEPVQEKIMSICQANLAANGVAFVSYNTNPAGHVRQALREIVHFHESRGSRQGSRADGARLAIGAILKAAEPDSAWKALLEREFKQHYDRDDSFVYHDDLSDWFSTVSLSAFARRAAGHDLQYLGEAELADFLEPDLTAETLAALKALSKDDALAFKQYLDFAQYRRFRRTLLCHAKIPLARENALEQITRLLVASPLRSDAKQVDGTVEFSDFRSPARIKTNNPVMIAAMRRLEKIWPRAEKFAELETAVLGQTPEGLRSEVSRELAKAFVELGANNLVEFRTCHLPLAEGVAEKPTASLLGRLMVAESGLVTTLLHANVKLEDAEARRLLALLDGTHDRQALADSLSGEYAKVTNEERLQKIEGYLESVYRMGLLIS
jgi:methyltransferase-like protein/SAM-dependent methyltransferase